MSAKTDYYATLAEQKTKELTNSWENWTAFLTTSGRIYKYPYHEQLMIHAQRPNATACAEYDFWNDKMHRYVKRGSTGIALLDKSGDSPRLRYVFDVADTGERRTSCPVQLWTMQREHERPIMEAMEKAFGVSSNMGMLEDQLWEIAQRKAVEYWSEYGQQFLDIVDESFLVEYDEYNIEVAFRKAASTSVCYELFSRCFGNPEDFFGHEDFLEIFDFNTRQTTNALGTAVNTISAEMFHEIEVTIRNYERNKQAERSQDDERIDLHAERGLSDSQHRIDEQGEEAVGQIRQDAPQLSGAEQADAVQRSDSDRETLSAPVGNRPDSGNAVEADNGTAPRTEPGTGQEAESDGLGAAHGNIESTGGRSDSDGAYQQLTLGNLFLSESQQISFIDEAESRTLPAFSFTQNEIDHILQLGSNESAGRMMVALDFMKGKPMPEIVDTLKRVYRGGFGLKDEKHNVAAWYGEDAIRLGAGNNAQYRPDAAVISWEDAANRIGELLEAGQYASNVELIEAPGYERSNVAESLWYLYHDFSEEAREMGFFFTLESLQNTGFPDQTAELAEKLADPEFLTALKEEYQGFMEAHNENPSLLRFHYHKLEQIEKRLQEIDLPLREYHTDMAQVQDMPHFITDDEMNMALSGGSGFSGGKGRIYDYWQQPHSTKERADFLKQEYGIGGRSHALSSATGSGENHDAKGIEYSKSDCDKVLLSWTQVANKIDTLIAKGRYIAEEDRTEEKTPVEEPAQKQETDDFSDIDTTAVREELTRNGIVDGEVVDGTALDASPFVEQVMHDVEELTSTQVVQKLEDSGKYHYQVGDTVYLDDTAFQIEEIGMFDVQLRDPMLYYPVFRAESKENLERLLAQDERNNPLMDEREMAEPEQPEVTVIPPQNFHITDDHIGEGSPKVKFARNVDAIRLLFQLENENRNATQEEQQVLSQYVGWGGLADAFDPDKSAWAQEYTTLKGLLSEEEYAAARASTLNAHYTSPTIIRAIYEGVEKLGFESGNILEPSMGTGNFFGMLPGSMQNSRLYGVELDSITGRLAQNLYPNADIKVSGFEKTDTRDFYDLAVGNVPFGNYKVSDKPYNKLGFSIHNYFFAKTLDQVRPGGVVAFVTSRYTMDSKDIAARKYMAERAELLGAIRLPNNAFKANAGAEVVSDILFLQKRDHPIDIDRDWVHLGLTTDGQPINSYFTDHPEMVLGELATQSTQYGKDDLTVLPIPNADLGEQLNEAITHIEGSYQAAEIEEVDNLGVQQDTIPADPRVKNFSFTVVDGEIYFRENSIMRHMEVNETAKGRIAGMVGLRQVVNELIEYQLEDYPDEMIAAKQQELDSVYDTFTGKYGLINARANSQAFAEDSSYYLLCSLENVDEDGKLESKADMFTKRTIRPERRVNSVDTPSEALAISIGEQGRVDLPFMAQLLGTPDNFERIFSELQGVIFRVPEQLAENQKPHYVTADEYLSGDVRAKLRTAQYAAQLDSIYRPNVEALEKAQPKDLNASEIDVRLGATWIDKDYIQEFMEETFEPPYYLRRNIEVKYSNITAEWQITGKSTPNHNDVAAYMTYGTDRANAYRILEETLNLKDIRIYDTIEDADGKQKRVLNKKETTLAQQKQQAIKDAFRDWIWKDPHRRETLVRQYNELFNSTRPREYDGSHIRFGGMNPDIKLREHQLNAIAHVLYGGNTLLAHEVGAGKTFEMAASAMESKRLGLSQKNMFVVPNHLTLQWANEFLHLYPSAKLLVATKKDFETARRKKFCARIATGDYDGAATRCCK